MKRFDNLAEAITDLTKRGFAAQFNAEDGVLTCPGESQKFEPKDVKIIETHRFEGKTDPADMAVVYAIQTLTGKKGTLIDAYGAYSNDNLRKFLREMSAK